MHTPQQRAYGLDLVRGCCAILVVCYHLLIWKTHREMHAWGLYGVYIFFVLSGASLTLAYKSKFDRGYPITSFLLLRFARLGPLWLVASAIMLAHKAHADGLTVQWLWSSLVSSSLLFGLGNPGSNSVVLGGWSLGIELVFYLVFPTFLAFTFSRFRWLAMAAFVVLQVAFVELTLVQHPDFREAWPYYTQPLAFIGYFFAGCLIGKALLDRFSLPGPFAVATALVCAAGILFLGAETAALTLTGGRGFLLMALSLLIVVAATQLRPSRKWQQQLCTFAGEISYGTYLLHPIVFIAVSKAMPTADWIVTLSVTLACTLVAAWLLEHHFEQPMREFARKGIEHRLTTKTAT